jgi:hypothetical protein
MPRIVKYREFVFVAVFTSYTAWYSVRRFEAYPLKKAKQPKQAKQS